MIKTKSKTLFYLTKAKLIKGTSLKEVERRARNILGDIRKKSKRKPYIRSAYFRKEKIFFDFFWTHLKQKNRNEQLERLRYFAMALDLIRNSRNKPISKPNPNNKREILHRFYGLSKEREIFCIQIKENKKSGHKYLLSVFKPKKPPH